MTDCSCIYVEVDEPVQVIQNKIRTSRKQQKCGECTVPIMPGDRYEYVFASFYGDHNVYKTCMTCRAIRKAFFCGGWIYGQVLEDLYIHIDAGEVECDCIAALPKDARDVVCDMIEAAWERMDP